MHTNINLQQQIDDLKWLINLRQKDFVDKLEAVINYCPCCVQRIIANLSFFSDDQLNERLLKFQNKQIDQINIDDIHEK